MMMLVCLCDHTRIVSLALNTIINIWYVFYANKQNFNISACSLSENTDRPNTICKHSINF